MSWTTGVRARLWQLFRRRSAEARMEEEFRFHLELEVEKNFGEGMCPEEARRRAAIDFGGVKKHKEAMREGRRLPLVEDLLRDVRYAVQALRRSPGFALIAITTLALGIGASTAMFSVLNGVLLRPLPVRDQDDVVVLWLEAPGGVSDHLPVTQGDLNDFRARTRTLEAVAGVAFQGPMRRCCGMAAVPLPPRVPG